jgi:hypothetical protein
MEHCKAKYYVFVYIARFNECASSYGQQDHSNKDTESNDVKECYLGSPSMQLGVIFLLPTME